VIRKISGDMADPDVKVDHDRDDLVRHGYQDPQRSEDIQQSCQGDVSLRDEDWISIRDDTPTNALTNTATTRPKVSMPATIK